MVNTDNSLRNHLRNDVSYIASLNASMTVNESQEQLYLIPNKHKPSKMDHNHRGTTIPMKASVNGGKINSTLVSYRRLESSIKVFITLACHTEGLDS